MHETIEFSFLFRGVGTVHIEAYTRNPESIENIWQEAEENVQMRCGKIWKKNGQNVWSGDRQEIRKRNLFGDWPTQSDYYSTNLCS